MRTRSRLVPCLVMSTCLLALAVSQLQAQCLVVPQAQFYNGQFTRLDPESTDPNGNSVVGNCGGEFPDAQATVQIRQASGMSRVQVRIRDARPNTLFTIWLRLQGTNAQGDSFGGSPLTGGGSTPLAHSSELDDLLAATGTGNGTTNVANGILTDQNGNGTLDAALDFPIFEGAYPFQRFENFDPEDPRFPLEDPKIFPVAIVVPNEDVSGSFGMRMVSHCTDELGHGLTPGAREPWFDWPE